MADNYMVCLVGAMDRLWFHQIVLFSKSISLLCPETLNNITSESLTCPSSNLSELLVPVHQISSHSSSVTPPLDDSKKEGENKEMKQQASERPTRYNNSLITSKTRSHSSSPSSQNSRYSSAMGRLQKSMCCKSMSELELEEVKGFMDLGFIFKKEKLSPRMMSVLPGLQRLGNYKNEQNTNKLIIKSNKDGDDEIEEEEEEEEEEKRGIRRPYLSEAWLIKRPNSPLLNLRIPRVSVDADMKEHIRFWARTVASEIQQES